MTQNFDLDFYGEYHRKIILCKKHYTIKQQECTLADILIILQLE